MQARVTRYILPEIRDVSTEGQRLHFRYHLHGVVRVNVAYAKRRILRAGRNSCGGS